MKKTLFYYMLPALVFASCTRDRSYTVEAEVDPSYNGKTAYMLDYHDGSVVDSTVVADGKFIFSGSISRDSIRRIDLEREYANLILEPGQIVVDLERHMAEGTPLNDAKNGYQILFDSLWDALDNACSAIRQDSTLDTQTQNARIDETSDAGISGFAELMRTYVSRGFAHMPMRSLTATPILTSPTSRPIFLFIIASSPERSLFQEAPSPSERARKASLRGRTPVFAYLFHERHPFVVKDIQARRGYTCRHHEHEAPI